MSIVLDGTAGITFPSGSGTQAAQSKVLQVVNATYSTQTSTTSTSFVTSGLNATITPLFSTSKILIFASATLQNPGSNGYAIATIFRGTTSGTDLGPSGSYGFMDLSGGTNTFNAGGALSYLDSPATTSAQIYTLAFRTTVGTSYIQLNSAQSCITLMEIAA